MPTLVFSPYDITSPLYEQKSNIAFMMLQGAVTNTQEKPEETKKASTWVNMNKLMTSIAALEHEITETVNTPQGPRQVQIVVLKPEGGEIELDSEAFALLKRLWEAHKNKNLNLSQARQVMVTEKFLNSVESTIVTTALVD